MLHLISATGGTAGGRKTKIGTGETPFPARIIFSLTSAHAGALMHLECIPREAWTPGNR
ncbi:MAG: hypothetical protein WD491_06925 [Balneolales bacterium]